MAMSMTRVLYKLISPPNEPLATSEVREGILFKKLFYDRVELWVTKLCPSQK